MDTIKWLEKRHHLSMKELSLLYEYWCFIKINALLRKRYKLISSDFITVNREGMRRSRWSAMRSRMNLLSKSLIGGLGGEWRGYLILEGVYGVGTIAICYNSIRSDKVMENILMKVIIW